MEDFLILFLQGFFELFFEILVNIPIYFNSGSWGPLSNEPSLESAGGFSSGMFGNPAFICLWLFMAGCMVGYVSLFLVDHSLITLPALRIANLVYAPVASGGVAVLIAYLRERDDSMRRFFYAAFFTFGLTMIRFTYARH